VDIVSGGLHTQMITGIVRRLNFDLQWLETCDLKKLCLSRNVVWIPD